MTVDNEDMLTAFILTVVVDGSTEAMRVTRPCNKKQMIDQKDQGSIYILFAQRIQESTYEHSSN